MDQGLLIERIGFFPAVTFVMFALGEHERGGVKISQEFFHPAEGSSESCKPQNVGADMMKTPGTCATLRSGSAPAE